LKQARDFWVRSGHHLLDRDADGRLAVTDEFLKAYLARPEIAPPPEACAAERELHRASLLDPRLPVARSQIAAIADADARENWEFMIAWRDHLAHHATLEASYLDIVRRSLRFPHLFIDQLAQVILRNILDGCDDPSSSAPPSSSSVPRSSLSGPARSSRPTRKPPRGSKPASRARAFSPRECGRERRADECDHRRFWLSPESVPKG
jgi:uncharacterized protein DUF6352